jgi:hypothetical protein
MRNPTLTDADDMLPGSVRLRRLLREIRSANDPSMDIDTRVTLPFLNHATYVEKLSQT